MSEYAGKFDKVLLERTKFIIEESQTQYKFTLILNCALSLICQPIEKLNVNIVENNKKGRKNLKNYEIVDQIAIVIKKYSENLKGENLQILRCLRNGIAHLNISAINVNGSLNKFKIKGTTIKNNIIIENTFEYTENNLKEL
ncbi:MAG: HEPN family nuclease [Cetobacterium sp.]